MKIEEFVFCEGHSVKNDWTDSRKSRQKMVKKRHTFVKIAKITAKSWQFI